MKRGHYKKVYDVRWGDEVKGQYRARVKTNIRKEVAEVLRNK